MHKSLFAALATLLLAACSGSPPPEAAAESAAPPAERPGISPDNPLAPMLETRERAKDVEKVLQQGAEERRREIDDAGG